MYPAQVATQNAELSGVITHDHQVVAKTVIQQTTEQHSLGSYPDVSFASDVHRVQALKPGGFVRKLFTYAGA